MALGSWIVRLAINSTCTISTVKLDLVLGRWRNVTRSIVVGDFTDSVLIFPKVVQHEDRLLGTTLILVG